MYGCDRDIIGRSIGPGFNYRGSTVKRYIGIVSHSVQATLFTEVFTKERAEKDLSIPVQRKPSNHTLTATASKYSENGSTPKAHPDR